MNFSNVLSTLWQDAFNDGERDAFRQVRAQFDQLRAEHGADLTAAHIEATLREREAWFALFDREAEEESAALNHPDEP